MGARAVITHAPVQGRGVSLRKAGDPVSLAKAGFVESGV